MASRAMIRAIGAVALNVPSWSVTDPPEPGRENVSVRRTGQTSVSAETCGIRDGAHTKVARDPPSALESAPDGKVRRPPPPAGGARGLRVDDGTPGAVHHGHGRGLA